MSDVEFIFGGSFDPIHFGHLHIIDNLQSLSSDWTIRVLPCAVPALKKQTSASFEQRVEMLQLALSDYNNILVDQRENARSGKSYSYDTLCELTEEYSNRQFILVIGSDNLDSIGRWHKAERLAKLCHLIVVNRPDSNVEKQLIELVNLGFNPTESPLELTKLKNGLFYHYRITERNTSSTAIRESLRSRVTQNQEDENGAQHKLSECKTETQASAEGLVEHSRDTALTSPNNQSIAQTTATLDFETPVAVKEYILKNSIY